MELKKKKHNQPLIGPTIFYKINNSCTRAVDDAAWSECKTMICHFDFMRTIYYFLQREKFNLKAMMIIILIAFWFIIIKCMKGKESTWRKVRFTQLAIVM